MRALNMQPLNTTHAARRYHSPLNALRRSAKACDRCRKRRTKCLGDPPHPCSACSDIGHVCVYSETQKKVTVSEAYLIELQDQARRGAGVRDGRVAADDLADDNSPPIELGFTGTDNWVQDNSGEYRFMGNSSSTYIANRLNPTAETLAWHKYPHYEDANWTKRVNKPELPQLPPREIAKRLYLAQKAYIGTIFSFLSDSAFYSRLELVYNGSLDYTDREDRLTYCQTLLVFAFGQMYSINQWVGAAGPPGFTYFKQALDFLPNMYEEASILFIETLSYVAYFMQTINRRDAAYLMIGTALRMAISLGLHQEVSDRDIDSETREHRRRVWWSTYSMERMLCVTSGHPLSIQDEDIGLSLPNQKSPTDPSREPSTLALYTELSVIQGVIGEKIYRKKQKSGPDLSAIVQDIMQRLADWFDRLPSAMRTSPAQALEAPSREVISTYLHYYHCINMTARPILLYAIQRQLAPSNQGTNVTKWEDGLPQDIVYVINQAISAARSSAAILDKAAKYNLVATYGFIDGEQAFSAALLLVMVNAAFPYNEMDASAMNMALSVLQMMADRGNSYIRACHSLLAKIRGAIKPAQTFPEADYAKSTGAKNAELSEDDMQVAKKSSVDHSADLVSGDLTHDSQAMRLDFEDNPVLWAGVLDSLNIDMDRQWVETAFRRGEHLDGLEYM